jgi:hypothetical protein
MLLYVDATIRDAFREAGYDAAFEARVVELLAMAYREGKHIICGDASALRDIAEVSSLSEMARGTLKKIASKCSEANGLRSALAFSVEIGRGTGFINQVEVRGASRVLRLDVRWFDDSARVQRAVMITENLSDSELYVLLAAALAAQHKWKLRIALDRRGGGGSTLAQALELLVRDRPACLCVVDSDKVAPATAYGPTARHVHGVTLRAGWDHVITTEVREIENLIPLALIEDALGANAAEPIARLGDLSRVGARDARDYADLKRGVRAHDVEKLPLASPARSFWENIEKKTRGVAQVRTDRCNDPVMCTIDRCGCFLVLGFGDALLRTVNQHVQRIGAHKTAERAAFFEQTELVNICRQVIAFGCALAPSFT